MLDAGSLPRYQIVLLTNYLGSCYSLPMDWNYASYQLIGILIYKKEKTEFS